MKLKKFAALILALLTVLSLTACNGDGSDLTTTNGSGMQEATVSPAVTVNNDRGNKKLSVAAPSDAGGFAFMKLAIERSYAYSVEIITEKSETSADELLLNGKVNAAVVDLETAAAISAQKNLKMLAIISEPRLVLVQKGEMFKKIAELSGKNIFCMHSGTYAHYILKEILADNGIKANIESANKLTLADDIKSGKIEYLVLPEPEATRFIEENPDFKKSNDITGAWKKDYAPVQYCLVADAAYADANPEIIAEFMSHVEVNSNFLSTETGAQYAATSFKEAQYISNSTEYNFNNINSCKLTFVEGEEMVSLAKANYALLNGNEAEIIPPADSFYYVK